MYNTKTTRDLVSGIRSSLKLVSSDDIITDRVIANALMDTNIKFVIQRADKRQGWASPNLFTSLGCLKMEQANLVDCCDYNGDCKISRSVEELPQIVECKYNMLVEGVWGVDKKVRFKEATANRYANSLNLDLNKPGNFFWIMNNHLYVSSPDIERVAISAFFFAPIDPDIFSCGTKPKCSPNPLDLPFKTLPAIIDDVVRQVKKDLMETYGRSIPDQQEDDKDKQ